ncbi:MAG: N-acetylmuramoyl-L-alanine amidase [Desulfovibrionaceae bacterium]
MVAARRAALALPLAVLLVALLAVLAPGRALALSDAQLFNQGFHDFEALDKNPGKAKYRSEWLKVERSFTQLYKRDPKGEWAPKALFWLGRVYEELGGRSALASDFEQAVDYFGRVPAGFPGHPWGDDALLHSAQIRLRRLNQRELAYRDLARIERDYPDGDMRGEAAALLDELDEKDMANARTGGMTETLAATGPAPAGTATLQAIRYRSSDDYTRVVLELDRPVEYVYKFLEPLPDKDKTWRVYVDLRGAVLGGEVPRNVEISDGILRGFRAGQNTADTARVVLDLQAHQDHKVFHLDSPFRIIIDVYSAQPGDANGGKDAPSGQAVAIKPDKSGKSKPSSPGDLLEQLGLTVRTVMIDPGHGGKDNGAVHNGIKEKDVNLKVALALGAILKKQGYKVLYTRTNDEFISLEDRTAMANMGKADLFLSLHCNAHHSADINGLEVYSLNLAKNQDAIRVAAKENSVDPKQISDLQYILSDLMLSSKIEESSDLAEVEQGAIIKRVRPKYGINDHGHREAPFYVLMGAKMPAVLIEMGYLTNPDEARLMKKDSFIKVMAQGIADGVADYKRKIERFSQL